MVIVDFHWNVRIGIRIEHVGNFIALQYSLAHLIRNENSRRQLCAWLHVDNVRRRSWIDMMSNWMRVAEARRGAVAVAVVGFRNDRTAALTR